MVGMWSAVVAGAPCAVGIAALVGAVAGEPPATRVPSRRSALVVLFAVAAGVLAGIVAAVVGDPLLGVSVAAGAWLAGAAGALWLARGAHRPDDGADGPEPGGGEGGGDWPGAPEPGGPGGAVDWAAFERDFWHHVHRSRRPVRQ